MEGAAERIDPAGANRRLERAVAALADSNLYPFEFRDFCVTESGNAKAASNWVMNEVLRKLKEDEQLQGIPVIVVTGISDDFKKFISSRRQVPPPEGYISKPVDAEQFLKLVGDLLG